MAAGFILILWHLDHSGIQQAFGPYDTEAEAQQARDDLKSWPALNAASHDDCWTIAPCTPTASPRPIVIPTAPYGGPQRQWWQNPIITCTAIGAPLRTAVE